jgi:hypothetical protein
MEKIILQRTKEEEIFKNSVPINQEWITPKETSIKKEKYIHETPNLIKIENNIASPLNDIIDLKAVNWIVYETALYDYNGKIIYDDEFYGDDGINRFDSINELIDEIKNIIERVKEQ